MCGTTWVEEQNVASGKDAFGLATAIGITVSVVSDTHQATAAAGTEPCTPVRLEFTGAAYCGAYLNSVTAQSHAGSVITKDFKVRLTVIGTAGTGATSKVSTGYKLNYKQTGCS